MKVNFELKILLSELSLCKILPSQENFDKKMARFQSSLIHIRSFGSLGSCKKTPKDKDSEFQSFVFFGLSG